jgi:hypothetical protein
MCLQVDCRHHHTPDRHIQLLRLLQMMACVWRLMVQPVLLLFVNGDISRLLLC